MNFDEQTKIELSKILLVNIKGSLPRLENFLKEINGHWVYEDLLYRFYHQSYKVYACFPIQDAVNLLNSLSPYISTDLPAEPMLRQILSEIPSKFEMSHNNDWGKYTRPIVEASLHLKYFIEMAVKYGKELEAPPEALPSGWASLLYYYGLR